MKILNSRIHGYMDYLAVALFAMAPFIFGFSGVPRTLSFVMAGAVLLLSLTTAYPWGVVKFIPFTIHGTVELLSSLALVAAPWILNFASEVSARNFFVAAGIAYLLLWSVTDYRAAVRRHAMA